MNDETSISRYNPVSEPDIRQLERELDERYQELMSLPALDADLALTRLAVLLAWASGTRGRLSRSRSRATDAFVRRELLPFMAVLDIQGRLLQKAVSIRRANRR